MRRRAIYAVLAVIALLLQATTTTLAFKTTAHGNAGECLVERSISSADGAGLQDGAAGGHGTQPGHSHCSWCPTAAPTPTPSAMVVISVTTVFSAGPVYADNFEARPSVRIDLNAPPTAPPALS